MRADAKFVLWAMFAALASGCGGAVVVQVGPEPAAAQPAPAVPPAAVPAPAPAVTGVSQETEPNNEPKAANMVAFGRPVAVRIDPKGDRDCFRVSVQKHGYVSAQAKDIPQGLHLQVRFCTFDEWKGEQVVRDWRFLPDACQVAPGEYCVQLIEEYHDAGAPETFPFRVDFLDEMDALEPGNNAAKTAPAVEPGGTLRPAIYPVGDRDCFKVRVRKPGYLSAEAKNVPQGLHLQVRFCTFDEWKGEQVVRDWRFLPDACQVAPGEYCVQLIEEYHDAGAPETFPFRISFLDEMDALEPGNNALGTAPALAPGAAVNPAIYPVGDSDWFRVTVGKQGYLALQARDVPQGLHLQVRFSTLDEKKGEQVVRDWHFLPDACRVVAGTYYVRLIEEYNDAASPETFGLRAEFVDEMDPVEPNDARAQAKEFRSGETKTLAIYPVGDRDYYAVRLPAAGTIRLQAQGVPPGIVLQSNLFTPREDAPDELREVGGWRVVPSEYKIEAGRQYYLALIDEYNDQSSPTAFSAKMEAFDEQGKPIGAAPAPAAQPPSRGGIPGVPDFEIVHQAALAAAGQQTVQVPNIVGMTRDEAARKLQEAGLAAGAVSGGPGGSVQTQTPAANTQVARGTAVNLVLSTTVVPDVVGVPHPQAIETLRAAGLAPVAAGKGWSDRYGPDVVSSQDPAAGTAVARGSQVRCTVSSGPPAVVPPLANLTVPQAQQILAQSRLTVGRISYTGEMAAIKKIVGQNPAPNTRVEPMSPVDLTVRGKQ